MCESSKLLGTEAWLSVDITGNEPLDPSFVAFRKVCLCKKGGGALVAVECLLRSFAINIVSDLEMLFVDVKMTDMNLVIDLCYRPPDFGSDFVSKARWNGNNDGR